MKEFTWNQKKLPNFVIVVWGKKSCYGHQVRLPLQSPSFFFGKNGTSQVSGLCILGKTISLYWKHFWEQVTKEKG